jgi:hypothetical protein
MVKDMDMMGIHMVEVAYGGGGGYENGGAASVEPPIGGGRYE